MNRFRQRLRDGETVFGQMVLELFTPGFGPMLAAAGMEFVIYDMEHGRCDIALASEMIASCRGLDLVPMVRVPDCNYHPLSRVLDIGARGVMVPRVETRTQAEEIVSQLKYAPQGRRGVALGIAHDLYRAGGAEYFPQSNEDIAVILLLETEKAFENLNEIVSVPGVDVAWMGHFDLTVSMGFPPSLSTPGSSKRWMRWSPPATVIVLLPDSFLRHRSPRFIGFRKVSAQLVWAVTSACSWTVCEDSAPRWKQER